MDPSNSPNPKNRIKTIFPAPPLITTFHEYQDVNKDPNLRKNVTEFFYKKSIKWVSKYSEFKPAKKHLKLLKSLDGYKLIYKLLRKFVKKGNTNWYDLRDQYPLVKDYIRFKLSE